MEKVAGRGPPPRETQGDLVTICAECKRVIVRGSPDRPKSGPPEAEALVSHGICEECARRLYGPIFNRTR